MSGAKNPGIASIGKLIDEYITFISYNDDVYEKAKELLEGEGY